jgi:phosphate transport system protein
MRRAAATNAAVSSNGGSSAERPWRELITYMIEDPRTISSCLDMVFVAKSFERIGDHATNIFEHVVYALSGTRARGVRVTNGR